jgi:hypothetical protein
MTRRFGSQGRRRGDHWKGAAEDEPMELTAPAARQLIGEALGDGVMCPQMSMSEALRIDSMAASILDQVRTAATKKVLFCLMRCGR